jgi:hypothetical protein
MAAWRIQPKVVVFNMNGTLIEPAQPVFLRSGEAPTAGAGAYE